MRAWRAAMGAAGAQRVLAGYTPPRGRFGVRSVAVRFSLTRGGTAMLILPLRSRKRQRTVEKQADGQPAMSLA